MNGLVNRKTYIGKILFALGTGLVILLLSVFGDVADIRAAISDSRVGGGYALTGQLPGVSYTTKLYDATNGMPTSEANCILGASDGYVWIAGYSGIIRYDGSVFERLPSSGGLTNGRGLFEDSQGRIWVATNDNGVVVLDRDETIHYSKGAGLASSSIRCFCEDKKGNIFIGSTAGVSYVDKDMNIHLLDDVRINTRRVLRLVSDVDGNVYGQSKDGAIFSLNNGKIDSFYTSADLSMNTITTIIPDPRDAGKLYIGTDRNYIYHGKYGDSADKMEKIYTSPLENIHWMSYDCGRLWISSSSRIGYLDKSGQFRLVENVAMDDSIEMMTSDYQGNMWFASSRQGVMKIITNNFQDYTLAAGVPDEVVNATCVHNGKLYVGTDTGLYIVGRDRKTINNGLTSYIKNARVRCIMSDSENNLWLSTFSNELGLVCYSAAGDITNYTTKDGMPSNEIRCTCETVDGSIVVGTNAGIAIIENGEIVKTIGSREGMDNTVILTVCGGDDGKIYVGTDGDGLYIIDGDKIDKFGADKGITSDVIMRVKKDAVREIYWIITSNSIEYMENGNVRNIESFPYNNNFDIITGAGDNLWVLSSQGLYSVPYEDMLEDDIKDYKLYNLANGLTSMPIDNSFNQLDGAGNLYIAGQTGVSKVNITHFYNELSGVITDVKNVLCDDEIIKPDAKGIYKIPSKCRRVQITPVVLDYTVGNPTVHVFLDGADDVGITEAKSDLGTLEYTGLKHGNYTLHIEIIDPVSGEIISDETFKFRKDPRIFELVAVRLILILLLVVAVGITVWRVTTGSVLRRQYKEISEAKEEAERANMAKSNFLANISHEIRTPINAIVGMNEMILRENADNVPKPYYESVMRYSIDVKSAAESLLELVNDLLNFAKIDSGKMKAVEQEYDIEAMLKSIIKLIRVRSEAKKLYFKVDVDETIPKRLYGDEAKIEQIILNLLNNSVKYTDEGGFTLKVSVLEKNDVSCMLSFSVKDTGMGMKKEEYDSLFLTYEDFAEGKNNSISGTGIGLDISRQYAEMMNGKFWCESTSAEGTEFILTLRQKIVDEKEIGIFDEEYEYDFKGMYMPRFIAPDADILVVDDNAKNLEVIKGLLKPTGMFVTTAESGEECLEKLETGDFNVVLLDHNMPGMDGLETVARIRELYPNLPVYAMTSDVAADSEEFYKAKGFNGYLAKPVDAAMLEFAIMRYLPEEIMMKPKDS